jgi:hypothetical protein
VVVAAPPVKVFPACGSDVVFEDFVWLWGSSNRQGASSAVFPSSSSPGRMWSS